MVVIRLKMNYINGPTIFIDVAFSLCNYISPISAVITLIYF